MVQRFLLLFGLLLICFSLKSQNFTSKKNILDQNITIFTDGEQSVSYVIEQICKYFNLDYSYNSKLLEGKYVSLNISNKPLRLIFDLLMKEHDLIFDIEDNILVARTYIPLRESKRYETETKLRPSTNSFRFENYKSKQITFPFKSASNLIIIPVIINTSDTLNFILDTGVRVPVITELPFVNKLNLNHMEPIPINGLGKGESLTAYKSSNNTLRIPGLISLDQEIHMIMDENFQISQVIGIPVHGLIGFDLFKDFIVEIDYQYNELTVTKPEKFNKNIQNKEIVLPLHFEKNKPFIRTSIMTDKNEMVSVKLLVDTGASDALWLSPFSDSRINIPEDHIESYLGKGLSGNLYGKKGRIGGIWMGPIVLNRPIVAFPDSSMVAHIITDNRNGTLGGEILRRFFVIVDYPGKQIRLRPTSKINDEFNYNMSGLDISNPIPGLPIFTIDKVRKDSPAYHAGLMEEDQIISLNNATHHSLSLNDINLLLQSKPARRINMTVLRNGQEITADFSLQPIF